MILFQNYSEKKISHFQCRIQIVLFIKSKIVHINDILKENPNLFGKELGLMENELLKKILEIISLRSKCYSIKTVDNVSKSKAKGIMKNYCKLITTINTFLKYHLMK